MIRLARTPIAHGTGADVETYECVAYDRALTGETL